MDKTNNIKRAFLIIDMQKGSFSEKTPRWESELVVARINKIAEKFRKMNLPVIFIQHDGSAFNEFIPTTEEWEILDELFIAETDLIISKTANDAFYATKLEDKLNELGATELVFSGCATDFCVNAIIPSGFTKDFGISVLSDAHTTADRPTLKAKAVIDHYNWVWKNMTPVHGTIQVLNTANFINKFDQ